MDEATSSVTQSHTGREGEAETGDCVSVGEESCVRQTGLLPYPAPHSLVGKKGPDLHPGLEPTPLSPAPSPHPAQPASFRVGSRGCGMQAAVDPAGCEVAMWMWQVCLSRLPAGAALLASGAGLEKAMAEGLQLPIQPPRGRLPGSFCLGPLGLPWEVSMCAPPDFMALLDRIPRGWRIEHTPSNLWVKDKIIKERR